MQRGLGPDAAAYGATGVPFAPGYATYRLLAQGDAATRFVGGAASEETLCVREESDDLLSIEDKPAQPDESPLARVLMRREAEAWRILGRKGRPPGLAAAALPAARAADPAGASPAGHVVGGMVERPAWTLAAESLARLRQPVRCRRGRHDGDRAPSAPPGPDLPHTIRLSFAPDRGMVRLRAAFADGQIDIVQAGFTPAARQYV